MSGAIKTDYHADESVSKTKLNHFATSPRMYAHYYVWKDAEPPKPKTEMVLGSAVHAVLLEDFAIENCVAVYPDDCLKSNGAINPKPAREFEAANDGKFIMKRDLATELENICEAVQRHELGKLVTHPEAVFEKPEFWTCETTGLPCRLMCDFYLDMGHEIIAYDLKTTENILPSGVRRVSKGLRYWLQDAHYSAGLAAIFGKPVRFRYWFVETRFPYRIAPWEYSPQSREIGREAYQQLMRRLAERHQANNWDDDWVGCVNYLQLNPWEVGADEEGEVAYVGEE